MIGFKKLSRICDKKGFTLLEILIAIALFAALVAMLYPAYIGTFRNIDVTESYGTIYRMARVALERISEDLAGACPPVTTGRSGDDDRMKGFLGKDSEVEGRDADELGFVSEKHISFRSQAKITDSEDIPETISEIQIYGWGYIRYYIDEIEGKDGFVLYRSDIPELADQSEDKAEKYILCEGLHGINFSFQDENGDIYDEWDSSRGGFMGRLPALVSVELEFINPSDPESPVKFITSVSLPLSKREYGNRS
ncbi:MAG TPA: prepilin-type N-terminal cleavage/methylation domain-containing protein [Desulfatiglandales bacterium]|nr:prepilin-type N-terminal cleavage/methylation domain-containing protein [Desulfatiglandales bacterium]